MCRTMPRNACGRLFLPCHSFFWQAALTWSACLPSCKVQLWGLRILLVVIASKYNWAFDCKKIKNFVKICNSKQHGKQKKSKQMRLHVQLVQLVCRRLYCTIPTIMQWKDWGLGPNSKGTGTRISKRMVSELNNANIQNQAPSAYGTHSPSRKTSCHINWAD